MSKTKKERYVIIDNSDNYFNRNEIVERVGRIIKGKRKYKSLERNFEAFITDMHVVPQSIGK